jgi:hypothetical protein
MTKLEQLKTARDAARNAYRDAAENAFDTGVTADYHNSYAACYAYGVAIRAYKAELKNQDQEPVGVMK